MRDLVIFGCGGHAREIHGILQDINAEKGKWNLLGFLDDDPSLQQSGFLGHEVFGGEKWLASQSKIYISIAVGDSYSRREIVKRIKTHGPRAYATLVHPHALVGSRTTVAEGTVIFPGCVLSVDVKIGCHAVINTLSCISHDSRLGDFVTLGPGVILPGNVELMEGCEVGAGATTRPGISIGSWSVIGAGGVVTDNMPPDVVAVGNPATVIKRRVSGAFNDAIE